MSPPDVPVAILAGGRATRLGSVASSRPKALVPLAGRPFIDHQLDLLRRRGFCRVVLCLGHLAEQVVEYVGDGAHYGLRVAYAFDGERPMGTGGALRRAAPLLGELCWVLYGDSYLDFDYAAVLTHFGSRPEPALMTVHRNEGRWDTSNVLYEGGRVLCYDKRRPRPEMGYIDYGASLLGAAAIARLPAEEPSDLADLYAELAAEGLLAGYEVERRFYEIGSPEGLKETERYLKERRRLSPSGALDRS